MSKRTQLIALVAGLFFAVGASAADRVNINWVVKPDQEERIDRAMVERLYNEACRWVEEHFDSNGKLVRPSLTVHVGEPCPNEELPQACLNAASGEVYLPEWDETSPGMVIQATIIVGMMKLVDKNDLRNVVRNLWEQDSRNFVSAKSMAPRSNGRSND